MPHHILTPLYPGLQHIRLAGSAPTQLLPYGFSPPGLGQTAAEEADRRAQPGGGHYTSQ
jgi:hypothetical protein